MSLRQARPQTGVPRHRRRLASSARTASWRRPENYVFDPGTGPTACRSSPDAQVASRSRCGPGPRPPSRSGSSGACRPSRTDWSFEVKPLDDMRAERLRRHADAARRRGDRRRVPAADGRLGLTGVLWQTVTQRTREIGLRRAKGATITDIRAQILGELLVMATLAVLLGTAIIVQFPLLEAAFGGVSGGVYAASLVISAAGHLSSDHAVRLVPEPDGDAHPAGRGAALRVGSVPMAAAPPSPGPRMILIVDDDPSVTASLALLLKQAGYAVARRSRRRPRRSRGSSARRATWCSRT